MIGKRNTFVGDFAGYSVIGGDYNTFIGERSGYHFDNDASSNIAIGRRAGYNVDGNNNTIIGSMEYCFCQHNNEWSNIAIGAGTTELVRINDTGLGIGTDIPDSAANSNNTQILNVGIVTANYFYGDGSNLTGISGGGAGFSPDADENLIAGTAAGASVDGTNSCFNIFLGACAGNANVAGANSIFLGYQFGRYTLNSSSFAGNIIIGDRAGQKFGCDSGDDPYNNVIIGTYAGRCTDMNSSVLIGNKAGCEGGSSGDQFNTFVGAYSGLKAKGSYNSYFGFSAGRCNNGGSSNVMIGVCAGQNMTGGSSNVFVGKYSGRQNTGKYNSAFGLNALQCKTAGDCNIALGYNAFKGSASLGHSNVALGAGAGFYQEGDCNVIIGAGVTSANSVTGSGQLAIGIGNTVWLRGDSSFNIYDKDGNQLNGGRRWRIILIRLR